MLLPLSVLTYKGGFGHVPRPRRGLQAVAFRIPRACALSPLNKMPACAGICYLAEKGGFEPPVGYEPTHAFQACDLNHSSTSPDPVFAFGEAADYSKNSFQNAGYLAIPFR